MAVLRGAKGVLAWTYFFGFILAILPTGTDADVAFETERHRRNVLFGGFGPPMPAVPAVAPPLIHEPGPGLVPVPAPPPPVPPPPPPVPVPVPGPGTCPGGPSLGKPCDAKRPWPQCPPHSYCFAVNSVDIGPYYCCPVWSTIGAQWRPAAPFYPYYPPMPYNWPYIIQATAHWGAQTSPAAGWLGQFGPAPGVPGGPLGAGLIAPAVPDLPQPPFPSGPFNPVPPPMAGPVPGPFDKARKKGKEQQIKEEKTVAAVAVAPAEKAKTESS